MTRLAGLMLVLASLPFWYLIVFKASNGRAVGLERDWTVDSVMMAVGAFMLPLLGFWLLTIPI